MNIDTLKTENGYREALVIDIERCLNAGHVTHLQRDSMVVAIRPNGDDGWIVEIAPNGITTRKKFFSIDERERAIRNVLRFLNGSENSYTAGDTCEVYRNQGERDGEVLAVIGNEILVEYLMPGTTSGRQTSALTVERVLGRRLMGNVRTYSHRGLPKRWVRAMHEQGTDRWEGLGQRERNRVPFPAI